MKKIIIALFAALFLLLVAAELYVQSDLFAAKVRPLVIAPLKEVLGEGSEIGWIGAHFIPMYIEVRDITLPDDQGIPAAAIRKIRISINPVPLLLKKIRLPSIMVLEPRVHAVRTRDGNVNILPVITRIRANVERLRSRGPSGYQLLLKSISVNQGTMTFKDDLSATQVTVSGMQATARVKRDSDSFSFSVKRADLRVEAPAYPALTGGFKASIRRDPDGFHLDDLDLSTGDTDITLSGLVGSLPDPVLDLRFKARSGPQTINRVMNLFKQLKKERNSRLEASASIRGHISDPAVKGHLQFSGMTYQSIETAEGKLAFEYRNRHLAVLGEQWKASRAGRTVTIDRIDSTIESTAHGIDIQHFSITADDLSIVVTGRADPQRGFDAFVLAESRNKGRTLSLATGIPFEGSITVKGKLTGALHQPLFDGSLSASNIRVRGILFDSLAGSIQYRDKIVRLAAVDIHQQAGRFIFNGSMEVSGKEPVFDAGLKVIRADVRSVVSLFYRPLPLFFPASGDLSFTGTPTVFTGNGRLSVDAGTVYGEAFDHAIVTAVLSRDRIAFPEVTVDKGSGTVTGTGWIGFDGTYSASIHSRKVRLNEVQLLAGSPFGGAFDLSIDSSGSFSRPEVRSVLAMDDLIIHQTGFGGMTADLQIKDKVLVCRAKLTEDHAVLSGKMNLVKPFPWSVQGTASVESFDPFQVIGKKEFLGRVNATVGASLTAYGNAADGSSLAASLLFRKIGIRIGDYGFENEGTAAVSVRGDRITVSSFNLLGQNTRIALKGDARFGKEVDLSLLGTANLSLLRPLVRDLEYSNGSAEMKISITDDWLNPEVSGRLSVRNGEIKLKDIPQKFSALNGDILFDQRSVVVDSLAGEFGGGTLNASGKAQLAGLALQDFSTRLNFENVTVRYPEGLTSTLSGDLFYDGDRNEQSLSGDVMIARARYDKRVEWKSMLVDLGKGLYQKKKTEAGWVGDTQINIRFYGKENILFQNNLAKIPLDVDMFLRGTVNRAQLLGRVEARKGTVFFRQNEFKILRAAADFVDPNRINPVLDIQAEIQVREYLVRLAVSGTADHAVVTLLSDPSLPDSDILALLALGKTGSELKGKEAGVGMSEAASFATGRFQDIFESRARSLTGLDRFQVDPYVSKGDTSVPRVTVGKELVQDKLYVTYSSNVGSTTPEQIFRIEYVLNRNFSLVGERNELGNTGADIKYRFEFR
jgi:translocation and assembly module TamB